MKFYSISNSNLKMLTDETYGYITTITSDFCIDQNIKYDGKAFYIDFCDMECKNFAIYVISKNDLDIKKDLEDLVKKLEPGIFEPEVKEVTFCEIVKKARRRGYHNPEYDEALEKFGLTNVESLYSLFGDFLCPTYTNSDRCDFISQNMLYDTFSHELDRICSNTRRDILGNPVHYLIETSDRELRKYYTRHLVSALYANNRLKSNRYTCVDIESLDHRLDCIKGLFELNVGGTLVIRFNEDEEDSTFYLSGYRMNNMELLKQYMEEYKNSVLLVICVRRNCERTKKNILCTFNDVPFVELREDHLDFNKAKEKLEYFAKVDNFETDDNLYKDLSKDSTYILKDIKIMYNTWYANKLKNEIYTEYKGFSPQKKKEIETDAKGDAYLELNSLIGLNSAKKVINQAIDFCKMQNIYYDYGINNERPSMHMIFTGNPGTAKTTVARLFSKIMRDNNVLDTGHIVEVGRADLVGKYVGWTAKIVKEKFDEASGGVLFIDEAYSLVDRDGLFGDEAINTIVQEMENNRDDVVVIFAGYPDKMEEFLDKNPGLRSRIAFHVPFEDYSSEELVEIAKYIAKEKHLVITKDTEAKLRCVFSDARVKADFGNGRYVRNIIEKAQMTQSTRLIKMGFENISKEDAMTILPSDIDIPVINKYDIKHIGFCA